MLEFPPAGSRDWSAYEHGYLDWDPPPRAWRGTEQDGYRQASIRLRQFGAALPCSDFIQMSASVLASIRVAKRMANGQPPNRNRTLSVFVGTAIDGENRPRMASACPGLMRCVRAVVDNRTAVKPLLDLVVGEAVQLPARHCLPKRKCVTPIVTRRDKPRSNSRATTALTHRRCQRWFRSRAEPRRQLCEVSTTRHS